MLHRLLLCLLVFAIAVMACAADVTVTMNGKTVTVPGIVQNGKAFVDLVALMKLLGSAATFNPATNSVTVGGPAGGGGSVSGTPQLPGDDGKLGQIYKMRKDRPLLFALLRAEYTTETVVIGDDCIYPNAGQKLLVLHFTIQNPNPTEELVRFDSLYFTAIDAINVNHEYRGAWGDEETRGNLQMQLKPAQKIAAYVALTVPAKGVIPKLMVLPGDGGSVLRYDLREKVALLRAPIADPADGATAREAVPAEFKTTYPLGEFIFTLEKFDYSTNPILGEAPEDGTRYMVFTMLMKNVAPSEQLLRFDSFSATLTSTDGEDFPFRGSVTFATADRKVEQNIKAGTEMRIRFNLTIPEGITPRTLSLQRGDGRMYVFTIPEQS